MYLGDPWPQRSNGHADHEKRKKEATETDLERVQGRPQRSRAQRLCQQCGGRDESCRTQNKRCCEPWVLSLGCEHGRVLNPKHEGHKALYVPRCEALTLTAVLSSGYGLSHMLPKGSAHRTNPRFDRLQRVNDQILPPAATHKLYTDGLRSALKPGDMSGDVARGQAGKVHYK